MPYEISHIPIWNIRCVGYMKQRSDQQVMRPLDVAVLLKVLNRIDKAGPSQGSAFALENNLQGDEQTKA